MAASYHAAVGDPAEALVELAEARTLAGPQRAPVVVGLQAGILAETGRAAQARLLADEALALADAGSHAGNQAFTRVSLGRALEACEEPDAAAARYREAFALYSEAGQLANAANARMHAAQVDLEQGRAQAALPELQAALETFRHFSSGQDETAARCALGRARFLLEDRENALRDLEAAVAMSEATREHHAAIAGRAYLAQALWDRDPERARELLAQALRLGEERQMALELAIARRIKAALG
jgi:tetratricopeptide (TPR) repeat protein